MAARPRIHVDDALHEGAALRLTGSAARHVQVLRLQPGDTITLFGGPPGAPQAGEFEATITAMGRQDVHATVQRGHAVSREAPRRVVLAVGMPANERMDWLVEKATELGVAAIQPLMSERSVLRLDITRAQKKQAHWQAIAVAACEQCGRNTVPVLQAVLPLEDWLRGLPPPRPAQQWRGVLSFDPQALDLRDAPAAPETLLLLGPEGGLSPAEEQRARGLDFAPLSLGPRVLRTDTAALAALALLA